MDFMLVNGTHPHQVLLVDRGIADQALACTDGGLTTLSTARAPATYELGRCAHAESLAMRNLGPVAEPLLAPSRIRYWAGHFPTLRKA